MKNTPNVYKSVEYTKNEIGNQNMKLNPSFQPERSNLSLEQKIDNMDTNFQTLNVSTSKMREKLDRMSENLVTKDELLTIIGKRSTLENHTFHETNVEVDVVKESASYAKQLINLLEEASLNYVSEKQSKDKLREELNESKKQLAEANEQKKKLEQRVQEIHSKLEDEKLNSQRIVAAKNKEFQIKEQEIIQETTKNIIYSVIDTIDELDKIWKNENNNLVKFLKGNGLRIIEEYEKGKIIEVSQKTKAEMDKYLDGIFFNGNYFVISSAFIIDNDVNSVYRGKVEPINRVKPFARENSLQNEQKKLTQNE